MQAIWSILRKDFASSRALRGILFFDAVMLGVLATADKPSPDGLSAAAMLLYVIIFVPLFAAIPRLIHEDSPGSSNSFYLTRPISRKQLLIAKLLPLVLIGLIFPALIHSALLLAAGIPAAYQIRAWAFVLPFCSAILFSSALLAALTDNKKDYLLLLFMVAVGFGAVEYAASTMGWIPVMAFYLTPSFQICQKAEIEANLSLITFYLLAGSASALAFVQLYLKRTLKPVRAPLALSAGLAVLVYGYNFSIGYRFNKHPPPLENVSVKLKTAFAVRSQAPEAGERSNQVFQAVFETEALPDGVFPHLLRFAALEVQDDQGQTHTFNPVNRGYIPCIPQAVLAGYIERQLGYHVRLERGEDCALGEPVVLPREADFRSGKISRLKGSAYGIGYTFETDYIHGFEQGPSRASGPLWAVEYNHGPAKAPLTDPGDYLWQVKELQLLSHMASTPLAARRDGSPLDAHWRAAPPSYVVINPQTGDGGIIDGNFITAGVLNYDGGFGLQVRPLQLTWTRSFKFMESAGWWRGAILIRITPRIQKTFKAPLELTDVPVLEERKTYDPDSYNWPPGMWDRFVWRK